MLTERRAAEGNLGGDFFAFRLHGPHRLAVVIGDACGRGKEGASLLPGVLSHVEELVKAPVRPSQLLGNLNRGLVGHLSIDRFVTGAAFEIDGEAGTLTIANAGHVPALLRRASGEVQIVGRASGPPLGILDNSRYFDETCEFSRGDVMVVMTDGILEAVETDLQGMPKLARLVGEGVASGGVIHRRLLNELSAQLSERDPDDMMLLSLEMMAYARKSTLSGIQAVA